MRPPYNYSKISTSLLRSSQNAQRRERKSIDSWGDLSCSSVLDVTKWLTRFTDVRIVVSPFAKIVAIPRAVSAPFACPMKKMKRCGKRKNGSTPLYERLKKEARANYCYLQDNRRVYFKILRYY